MPAWSGSVEAEDAAFRGRDLEGSSNGIGDPPDPHGDDTLRGGRGEDSLDGQGGADLIFGGPRSDFLFGQGGRDLLVGGRGPDHLNARRDGIVDRVYGGPGFDDAFVDAFDLVVSVESINPF